MKLKFTSPSGIIVSTVKLPYTKAYETMIFDSQGNEIFSRRYTDKGIAEAWHNKYEQ